MNLYFHRFQMVTFSRGKDFMPVGRWGSDKPAKMVENLQIDWLATFETYVIPVSEGGIAGEIPRNIMVDIAENIVP
jgi:hypothetical protein